MPARHATPKKPLRGRRTRKGEGYTLKVLFIEENGGWAAQVLEHDIATQADTLQELFHAVERILVSHVALADAEKRAPFEGIPPAPRKYWEIFKKSQISMRRPLAGLKTRNSRQTKIKKNIRIAEKIAA